MPADGESQKRIQFLEERITILEAQRSRLEETIRVKNAGLMQVQPTTSTCMTGATKPLLTLLTTGSYVAPPEAFKAAVALLHANLTKSTRKLWIIVPETPA